MIVGEIGVQKMSQAIFREVDVRSSVIVMPNGDADCPSRDHRPQ